MPGNQVVALRVFPILTGKPFKADVHMHRVMTVQRPVMQDGKPLVVDGVIQTEKTVDTQDTHRLLARDSLGRVTQRVVLVPSPASDGHRTAADIRSRIGLPPGPAGISDPVAMVYWQWGLQPNRVQKVQIPPSALQATDPPLTRCISQNGQDKTWPNGTIEHFEDLGQRTIQNIVVRGCRITTTRPANANARNSGPFQAMLENWVSPELRAIVLSVEHDGTGERTTAYENIVTGEPDASLFNPPADYAVDDLNAKRDEAENLGAQLELGAMRGEDIAGPWETDDPIVGKGSQIGILLRLSVSKAVRFQQGAVTEVGASSISDWQLGVYQKMGPRYDERSFRPNEPRSQISVSWDGKRLQVNFSGGEERPFPLPPKQPGNGGPEMALPQWQPGAFSNASVALDLIFSSPNQAWTGTYTLNGTTKQVRLVRPGTFSITSPSPFVGTWTLNGGLRPPDVHTCLQIAERQDGSFVAWQNGGGGFMRMPGRPSNVPGVSGRLSPIATTSENDGQPFIATVQDAKLTLEPGVGVSLGMNQAGFVAGAVGVAGGAGVYRFTGTLSADGSQIVGEAPKLPNSPSGVTPPNMPQPSYTRVPGGNCSSLVASTASNSQ
jgi:hypothetical protein